MKSPEPKNKQQDLQTFSTLKGSRFVEKRKLEHINKEEGLQTCSTYSRMIFKDECSDQKRERKELTVPLSYASKCSRENFRAKYLQYRKSIISNSNQVDARRNLFQLRKCLEHVKSPELKPEKKVQCDLSSLIDSAMVVENNSNQKIEQEVVLRIHPQKINYKDMKLIKILDTRVQHWKSPQCKLRAKVVRKKWRHGVKDIIDSESPEEIDLTSIEDMDKEEIEDNFEHQRISSRQVIRQRKKSPVLKYRPRSVPGSIDIYNCDLECLKPKAYLNDQIVDFYLLYLHQEKIPEKFKQRIHIVNSFFYYRMFSSSSRTRRNGDWENITCKDFIFIPRCHAKHWYLVAICFLPDFLNEYTRDKGKTRENATFLESRLPCICFFDSLPSKKYSRVISNKKEITSKLKEKIVELWTEKHPEKPCDLTRLSTFKFQCPKQENYNDCGLFLLQYFQSFFENPIPYFKSKLDIPNISDWFSQDLIDKKRGKIKEEIKKEVKKQAEKN